MFIFCVNKREVVQEYMARSKWPSSVAVSPCVPVLTYAALLFSALLVGVVV